ncbi:MAG: EamA family transporter [Chloroflexi bacterium]|nr:EamA family transporter [Chloroflexota bacterium]
MGLRDLGLLVALGAIWGGSFLFIKVSVSEVTPLTLVTVRLSLGMLGLLAYLSLHPGALPTTDLGKLVRAVWRPAVVIGVVAAIAPYLLIAWGEQHLTSGAAAILNATSPLFSALLAAQLPARLGGERLSLTGSAGILVGFGGVALLVGSSGGLTGAGASQEELWGAAAVLLASLCYAIGGLYTHHVFAGVPPLVPAVAQNTAGALILVGPALVLARPEGLPSPAAIGAMLALGLVGTALAYLLYFDLLVRIGGTRTLLVTYLLPGTALVYGAVLLSETVPPNALAGLALILLGIALTTGTGAQALGWLRRRRGQTGHPAARE